jgi:hypothetical protein
VIELEVRLEILEAEHENYANRGDKTVCFTAPSPVVPVGEAVAAGETAVKRKPGRPRKNGN